MMVPTDGGVDNAAGECGVVLLVGFVTPRRPSDHGDHVKYGPGSRLRQARPLPDIRQSA